MRTVRPADVAALAANMRPEDAAEVLASSGLAPLPAIIASVKHSEHSWTLLIDGEVAAIFGAHRHPTLTDGAFVWALTSTVVDRHRKTFARISRDVLRILLDHYPYLENAVDGRYLAAIRWIRWLGGYIAKEGAPFGRAGLPFHHFHFRRTPCASPSPSQQ